MTAAMRAGERLCMFRRNDPAMTRADLDVVKIPPAPFLAIEEGNGGLKVSRKLFAAIAALDGVVSKAKPAHSIASVTFSSFQNGFDLNWSDGGDFISHRSFGGLPFLEKRRGCLVSTPLQFLFNIRTRFSTHPIPGLRA